MRNTNPAAASQKSSHVEFPPPQRSSRETVGRTSAATSLAKIQKASGGSGALYQYLGSAVETWRRGPLKHVAALQAQGHALLEWFATRQ